MARLRDLLGYKTYAIRSDGAKFVNGVRDDGADTSWLTYQVGVLTLGPGLYDELLILNRAATEDEILAWYKAQSPFYDSSSIIQGTHIADGAITTEKLAANSVTAGKIAAGAVKANAIDVDELSAISANLGTVTAGIVQTPDGRAKFGEGALGSGKHGMLISDGTQDRVAVGDISGRPWGNTTLPSGSYGVWGSDARLFLKQYPRFYGMGTAEFNIEIPQGSAGDTIIGITDTVEFVDYHGNPFPSISLVNGRTLHRHVSLQSVESWVGNGNEYVMIQILNYFFRATVDGVPDQFIFFSGPEQFEKLALRISYMMYYVKDQPFPFNQVPRGVRVVVSGIFLEEESTPAPIVYPF